MLRRNNATLDCLCHDRIQVEPGTVVGDLDIDLPAFVESAQQQQSLARLSCCLTHGWSFYAVIERIANDVGERILDGLDDCFVELGLRAFHLKPYRFAGGIREVAHDAREFVPDVSY